MGTTVGALGMLAFGTAVALVVAGGTSACGGMSAKHGDDEGSDNGGTGNASGSGNGGSGNASGNGGSGNGGTGNGGSGGASAGAPSAGAGVSGLQLCTTASDYYGEDYVNWFTPLDESCEGAWEQCYDIGDTNLAMCQGTGPYDPASRDVPPGRGECPNVKYLCESGKGCCEDAFVLVAGGRIVAGDSGRTQCCFLAQRAPFVE